MSAAYFSHLASYNQWMNRKLYNAAAVLSDEQLHADKGAFFHSIFGTLNHLVVADVLWLKRIAAHPAGFTSLAGMAVIPLPAALDQPLCASLPDLTDLRASLDEMLHAFCAEVTTECLDAPFDYASTKGVKGRKRLGEVLLHVFNHQTHHRGQVTTLLSQMGIDIGATDLILLMPNVP
ncbi:MAG: DinB family protein [Aquabacterium sp.]|uniref:DinB family protein n=1 Tax=Aquabacterium sp. TaxID=1872578 RepID=UPI003BEDF0F4